MFLILLERIVLLSLCRRIRYKLNKVSKGFKGKLLVISREFLDECNTAKRSPSMANYMQLRKNPCTTFEAQETELVDNYIELLRSKIKNRTHFFQKEVMQRCVCRVSAGNSQHFHGQEGWFADACPFPKRRNCPSNSFNCSSNIAKEQHVVTFYAEKLFITPQYLSLILKELTGKSANKWIDDALIVEAKILLKAPQATVQQVADMLHFSDQSTFGKFFKKHMGISPMEYRKS